MAGLKENKNTYKFIVKFGGLKEKVYICTRFFDRFRIGHPFVIMRLHSTSHRKHCTICIEH